MYKEEIINSNDLYNREVNKTVVLTKEEEKALFKKYKNGDEEAKNKLIISNLRLVRNAALKYKNPNIDYLDLVGEGNLALITAVETFDPDQGYKFSTYATRVVISRIANYINSKTRTVRLPANIISIINLYHKTRIKLEQELLRKPTFEEIAKKINIDEKKLIELLQLSTNFQLLNLDTPAYNNNEEIQIKDTVFSEDDLVESQVISKEENEKLDEILDRLSSRERYVLEERYGFGRKKGRSLQSIGEELSITGERVRQIQNAAMRKLRSPGNYRELEKTAYWKNIDEDSYKQETKVRVR